MSISKESAFALMQQYINGWKLNDIEVIISSLDSDCTVIESHGPTYYGIIQMRKWFNYWMKSHSQVLEWNIKSFYFCDIEQRAFCEWEFICESNAITYDLQGISVVKFKAQKIVFIHEYRMTNSAYDWQGDCLVSE